MNTVEVEIRDFFLSIGTSLFRGDERDSCTSEDGGRSIPIGIEGQQRADLGTETCRRW